MENQTEKKMNWVKQHRFSGLGCKEFLQRGALEAQGICKKKQGITGVYGGPHLG